MTPEQAKFLAHSVGAQLQQEWKTTYKVIAAVPEDKKNYKPDPNSRDAWFLAHHIATVDVGFLRMIAANNFAAIKVETTATTVAALADWYKHEFPKALEQVLALDGQHLSQTLEAFGVLKMPSAAFVLFCNNHMVHHRGQLSTYLRAMGSKVPSIYGSSFDEKMQM
jgi:uncharacterized damage-inducible protein DinB